VSIEPERCRLGGVPAADPARLGTFAGNPCGADAFDALTANVLIA